MSNNEEELRRTAASKRQQAKNLQREADNMERKANLLRMPRVMFEVTEGRTLSITQAQMQFIHITVRDMKTGQVHVIREAGERLIVTANDERWVIDEIATVHQTEGFDGFDNDWVTK